MAKQATTRDQAARLRREAEVLEMARHPGVVEVLGLDGDPERPVLLTAHVAGPTLVEAGDLAPEEVAGVLAALAATLADLHDLGVVHGAVTAEHVILDADGAPVLCGFGDGGRIGQQPAGGGAPFDASLDVFQLGMLARLLCPPATAEGRALRGVADAAVSAGAADRPTARALADSMSAAVAGAHLPRAQAADAAPPAAPPPTTAPDPLDAWRLLQGPVPAGEPGRGRRTVVVGAAVIVLIGVVGAVSLRTGSPSTPPAPTSIDDPVVGADQPATTAVVETSVPDTPVPSHPGGRPECPAVPSGPAADVDGDGCSEPVRYAGGVLEAGDARWSLGRVGDQVATGDWSCTGVRTVALLRPSTGELFRFEGWAGPGAGESVVAFARVPGAVALRAADLDQDGCHEMVVERDGAPAEVVRPPRAAP